MFVVLFVMIMMDIFSKIIGALMNFVPKTNIFLVIVLLLLQKQFQQAHHPPIDFLKKTRYY